MPVGVNSFAQHKEHNLILSISVVKQPHAETSAETISNTPVPKWLPPSSQKWGHWHGCCSVHLASCLVLHAFVASVVNSLLCRLSAVELIRKPVSEFCYWSVSHYKTRNRKTGYHLTSLRSMGTQR